MLTWRQCRHWLLPRVCRGSRYFLEEVYMTSWQNMDAFPHPLRHLGAERERIQICRVFKKIRMRGPMPRPKLCKNLQYLFVFADIFVRKCKVNANLPIKTIFLKNLSTSHWHCTSTCWSPSNDVFILHLSRARCKRVTEQLSRCKHMRWKSFEDVVVATCLLVATTPSTRNGNHGMRHGLVSWSINTIDIIWCLIVDIDIYWLIISYHDAISNPQTAWAWLDDNPSSRMDIQR